MPAQLIVVAMPAVEKAAGKSIKATEEAMKELGLAPRPAEFDTRETKYPVHIPTPVGRKTGYPPYIQVPVGLVALLGGLIVFGQKPLRMGHFADVATLLDKVRARKRLPGGSNTLYASVENLDDLQLPPVRDKLNKLPKQLTIVVHEAKLHG